MPFENSFDYSRLKISNNKDRNLIKLLDLNKNNISLKYQIGI